MLAWTNCRVRPHTGGQQNDRTVLKCKSKRKSITSQSLLLARTGWSVWQGPGSAPGCLLNVHSFQVRVKSQLPLELQEVSAWRRSFAEKVPHLRNIASKIQLLEVKLRTWYEYARRGLNINSEPGCEKAWFKLLAPFLLLHRASMTTDNEVNCNETPKCMPRKAS